jgi:hypothetical protein
MLSALCFVLRALCSKSHLLVKIGCFMLMLCAWLCATKRPDFYKQERLPAAARHLLRAHALCMASGDQKTRKAQSMSTEHKAQSRKHEHKA